MFSISVYVNPAKLQGYVASFILPIISSFLKNSRKVLKGVELRVVIVG